MINTLQKTRLGTGSEAGLRRTLRLMSVLLLGLVMLPPLQAQTFTTIYSFTGGSNGGAPEAGVIQDSAGNLYGTTFQGGECCGVVYKIDGVGKEILLHAFCSEQNCADGEFTYT